MDDHLTVKTVIYPKNYCVFDFETTGLDPYTCKIIEIGALKVREGQPDEQFTCLINWSIPVPENITEITGITQQEIDEKGIDPETARNQFKEFIETLPLIGHNIRNFDLKFLVKFFNWTFDEWNDALENYLDTAAMYKAKKLGTDRQWDETFNDFAERVMNIRAYGVKFNVGIACEEMQIEKTGLIQHRAMADVILTNKIFERLTH
jgi:DNA polymerase III subunit alpha, Gram-positive type